MKIEIQKPELQALIRHWMRKGGFRSVEDALMQALKSQSQTAAPDQIPANPKAVLTGAVLVAAMQASPHKEISLEPERNRLPVRDTVL